jgi:hypothetical protein
MLRRLSATLGRRAWADTVVGERGTRRANWVAVGLEERFEDVAVKPAEEDSREALLALSRAGSDFESMAEVYRGRSEDESAMLLEIDQRV